MIYVGHMSLKIAEFCELKKIKLWLLKPFATHILQPLDLTVFGPFKTFLFQFIRLWQQNNAGDSLKKYDVISEAAYPALEKVFKDSEVVKTGFRKSGIFPWNPEAVDKKKLSPSKAFIQEEDSQERTSTPQSVSQEKTSNSRIVSQERTSTPRSVSQERNSSVQDVSQERITHSVNVTQERNPVEADVNDEFYSSSDDLVEADTVPETALLPWCADKRKVACCAVGEDGALLRIPGSSVTLTVPEGAVDPSKTVDLWVCEALKRKIRTSIDKNDIVASPIVVVGPNHLPNQLKKPIVISIPHIVGGGGHYPLRVLQCDRLASEPMKWKCIAVSGQDNSLSNTSIFVDSCNCVLVTDELSAYVVVANKEDMGHIGGGSQERYQHPGGGSKERYPHAAGDSQERNLHPRGGSQERYQQHLQEGSQERSAISRDVGEGEYLTSKLFKYRIIDFITLSDPGPLKNLSPEDWKYELSRFEHLMMTRRVKRVYEGWFREKMFDIKDIQYQAWLLYKRASIGSEAEALDALLYEKLPKNLPKSKSMRNMNLPPGHKRWDCTGPEWKAVYKTREKKKSEKKTKPKKGK